MRRDKKRKKKKIQLLCIFVSCMERFLNFDRNADIYPMTYKILFFRLVLFFSFFSLLPLPSFIHSQISHVCRGRKCQVADELMISFLLFIRFSLSFFDPHESRTRAATNISTREI